MDEHSNPALVQAIRERIGEAAEQRIDFATFMDLALYHPEHGYYASHAGRIGFGGDYFTAVHLGSDYGDLLAVQFAEMWEHLGRPERFDLVEAGVGQGLLAADVIAALRRDHPRCFAALVYTAVEAAPAQAAAARNRLAEYPQVRWSSLEQIPAESLCGCLFSNELLDALPVHRFRVEGGQLRELWVAWKDDGFVEVVAPPASDHLERYLDELGVPWRQFPDGFTSEINLAALEWLATVARRLGRGFVLTVDYGYTGAQYYNPLVRSRGTLLGYRRHAPSDDPYRHVGTQDLTAHVDFDALQHFGARVGLATVGFTRQNFFLWALGLGERLAALARPDALTAATQIPALLRQRDALRILGEPGGLGEFGVLIQCKNLDPDPRPLRGLRGPG